jgi:hypothetical protein
MVVIAITAVLVSVSYRARKGWK